MSVVIAIKKDNVVYMAADTMITYGDSKRHLYSESSQKIWAVDDTPNCIMGATGYLRDINLIHHCTNELVPEAAIIKEDLNIGIIMTYTVPTIFETIRNYTKVVTPEGQPIEFCSSFLYAYKNHLFSILPDGLVEEIDDYTANLTYVGNYVDKWSSFGFDAVEIDGHNYDEIINAIENAKKKPGKPHIIILDTIKGKGVSFVEKALLGNHSMPITSEQLKQGLEELKMEDE